MIAPPPYSLFFFRRSRFWTLATSSTCAMASSCAEVAVTSSNDPSRF